jgi:hypothetical protein
VRAAWTWADEEATKEKQALDEPNRWHVETRNKRGGGNSAVRSCLRQGEIRSNAIYSENTRPVRSMIHIQCTCSQQPVLSLDIMFWPPEHYRKDTIYIVSQWVRNNAR